jgi:uncharacterized Zn finger protein
MSEPYDGGECPTCGSDNTGSYTARSTNLQGFGARCYDCGTVWRFSGTADPGEPTVRSLADQAFYPGGP